MISLSLLNHSHRRAQKRRRATNYCNTVRSLVMVRNQLPARGGCYSYSSSIQTEYSFVTRRCEEWKVLLLVTRANITFRERWIEAVPWRPHPRRGRVPANCSQWFFRPGSLATGRGGRDRSSSLGSKLRPHSGISPSTGNALADGQIKDVSAFYEILMSKRVCRAMFGSAKRFTRDVTRRGVWQKFASRW